MGIIHSTIEKLNQIKETFSPDNSVNLFKLFPSESYQRKVLDWRIPGFIYFISSGYRNIEIPCKPFPYNFMHSHVRSNMNIDGPMRHLKFFSFFCFSALIKG